MDAGYVLEGDSIVDRDAIECEGCRVAACLEPTEDRLEWYEGRLDAKSSLWRVVN
jgi:hypothetical protein